MKVGPGTDPGAIRVRYAAPNLSHGGCPFMTEFDLSGADYTAARAAFTAKTDEASKKVDDLKKQLGEKWNELTMITPDKLTKTSKALGLTTIHCPRCNLIRRELATR